MYPRLLAPNRPDWRWVRVVELAQYSTSQATARLRSEDEQVRRAFAFKRALDRGTPDEFPVEYAAHFIFLNMPVERFLIEGMLLGGEMDDAAVARFTCQSEPEVIGAYHDLFFDVRERLMSPGWIAASVFGGLPYQVHHRDVRGIALRISWILGSNYFQTIIDTQRNKSKNVFDATMRILEPVMLEMALTVSSRRESNEWVKAVVEQVNKLREQQVSGATNNFDEAAGKFLEGLGISVADPTDERNLNLPAQEPRALAYEVAHDRATDE